MKEDHYFNNNLAIIEQVDEHKHEAKTELTKEMMKMDKVSRYWLQRKVYHKEVFLEIYRRTIGL